MQQQNRGQINYCQIVNMASNVLPTVPRIKIPQDLSTTTKHPLKPNIPTNKFINPIYELYLQGGCARGSHVVCYPVFYDAEMVTEDWHWFYK